MSNVYHYAGMPLHYLSESKKFAVYHRQPRANDKPETRQNPWMLDHLDDKWDETRGWYRSHTKLGQFYSLNEAIYMIPQFATTLYNGEM